MNRRHSITLWLLAFCLTAKAADSDTTLVEHTGLWQTTTAAMRQNPALHGVAFASSFSQLYAEVDWQHQSQAFVPQEGRGFLLPAAHVDTYLRLSDQTAVWGHASYMNGSRYDVKWNSTADYQLLQPYVLADTLGGDTQREQYRFEGGYATRLGSWLLGAEMLFRADHEYRDVDPRMRGIVNTLTLRMGGGREAAGYRWAAAFEGSVYKQQNSVDFYRELGVIPEYQMTGLGTEYARFSGDKRSLHYEGGGVRLLLDADPATGSGAYVHAELAESRYHRQVVENYMLPLTDLYVQGVSAVAGWKQTGRRQWAVSAAADYTKRSGDEHIIGTSATTSFPDLGVLTMYKNHLFDTRLTALYGAALWHLQATFGYRSTREEYVYPERQLNAAHVYGGLQGEMFVKAAQRLMLTGRVKAGYAARVSDSMTMPFADMTAAVAALMRHTYAFARANYADVSAQVRGDYAMQRYGLFAELGGGFVSCSEGERQVTARLAVVVTF